MQRIIVSPTSNSTEMYDFLNKAKIYVDTKSTYDYILTVPKKKIELVKKIENLKYELIDKFNKFSNIKSIVKFSNLQILSIDLFNYDSLRVDDNKCELMFHQNIALLQKLTHVLFYVGKDLYKSITDGKITTFYHYGEYLLLIVRSEPLQKT
jgi:hypothetical protein